MFLKCIKKKSLFFLFFIFLERNFFLHWINLDHLRLSDFFGVFEENCHWRKGVLEHLLDSIYFEKEHSFFNSVIFNYKQQQAAHLIAPSYENFAGFNSTVANNRNENKKFGLRDFIIYEIGEEVGITNEALEQVVRRKVMLNNGRRLEIKKGITQIIEVILL